MTASVSESVLAPIPVSETAIALPFVGEKVSDPFSARAAVAGAVMLGGAKPTMFNDTLVEADLMSPTSVIVIASVSDPV